MYIFFFLASVNHKIISYHDMTSNTIVFKNSNYFSPTNSLSTRRQLMVFLIDHSVYFFVISIVPYCVRISTFVYHQKHQWKSYIFITNTKHQYVGVFLAKTSNCFCPRQRINCFFFWLQTKY